MSNKISSEFRRKEAQVLEEKVLKFLEDQRGSAILLQGERGCGKEPIVTDTLNKERLKVRTKNKTSDFIYVVREESELFADNNFSFFTWRNIIKELNQIINGRSNKIETKKKLVNNKKIKIQYEPEEDLNWNELVPDFSAELELHTVMEHLLAYFTRVTQKTPLIVFINNIQWSDKSSLEFLKYLCENLSKGSLNLLLILTYSQEILIDQIEFRNNFKKTYLLLQKNNLIDIIIVNNLSNTETKKFIESEFAANNFPEEFYQNIYELSGGNIYFIDMILKHIVQLNNISDDSLRNFNFPPNIFNLLSDYLSELPGELREILDNCSVMGEIFSLEIIAKMMESNNDLMMYQNISKLTRTKYIINSEQKIGDLKEIYQFYQFLICKFIYSSYDPNFRLKKHRLIAELIKGKLNDSLLEYYVWHLGIGNGFVNQRNEIIINHNDMKDESVRRKATEYFRSLISLSEKYQTQIIYAEAVDLYDKIIKLSRLLNDIPVRILFTIKKIFILKSLGKYDPALKEIDELILLSSKLESETIAFLKLCRGEICECKNKNKEALKFFQASLKIYQKLDNEEGIAKVFGRIATIYNKTDNYKKAIEFLNLDLEICRKNNFEFEEHLAKHELGNIFAKRKNYEKAIKIFKSNLKFYKVINDERQRMKTLANIGEILSVKDNIEGAKKYFNEALKLSREVTIDRRQEMIILGNLTNININKGEFEEALEKYRVMIDICKSLNDSYYLSFGLGNTGIAHQGLKNFDKAVYYLTEAVKICKTNNFHYQGNTFLKHLDQIKKERTKNNNPKLKRKRNEKSF